MTSTRSNPNPNTGLGLTSWASGWALPTMPSLGGWAIPNYGMRRKKSSFDIAPSFTAIVQNIKMTSPLKVSKSFGVTPFQSRGLLVNKKGKAAGGSYFKFTDI